MDFPFDVMEILAFVIIGVIAGLAAANFVIFHKYMTKQLPKVFKTLNQRSVLYPLLCGLMYSTLTFPGKCNFNTGEAGYQCLEYRPFGSGPGRPGMGARPGFATRPGNLGSGFEKFPGFEIFCPGSGFHLKFSGFWDPEPGPHHPLSRLGPKIPRVGPILNTADYKVNEYVRLFAEFKFN